MIPVESYIYDVEPYMYELCYHAFETDSLAKLGNNPLCRIREIEIDNFTYYELFIELGTNS